MIEIEDRGGVRVVALRRPPVNALNIALVEALADAIGRVRADPAVRALVLTGTPGVFSAGVDTREVPNYGSADRATMLRAINRMVAELYTLPKPAIAAISGHALGGALVLTLPCDARFAARGDFRLGFSEAAVGIPFPAGPLAVLRAELSPESARVLALGAAVAPPDSPLLRGVIDRVVAPASLIEEAVREGERLASLPSFARVKEQLRAATAERLRQIVEHDDEPLLTKWM